MAAIVKSARDIMRTDEGLNGDLDRLPQLAWLLFLRCLDAKEDEREVLEGEAFTPAIKPEYRWKKWAADPRGRTGQELINFVNTELLPYLANLEKEIDEDDRAGFDPRLVISAVFKDLTNRMRNGALLREVIDQVHKVDFTQQEDVHTMAALYEGILREMRDAAGDSGEFYTPRPLNRFMVQQLFLELGESILDPACGTGGFLVEALAELAPKALDNKQIDQLHANLRGIEKKSLPFLLCNMNLLLHDIPQPHVLRANALVQMRKEIGAVNKVDVILTNPPFGGEEEKSVSDAFDVGFQSRETAWLFLYAIIDKLKRGGRCGIVLPNGVLFGNDNVATKIKEKLLAECNLHTVVRLQQGVFAPYTDIPANLLFFEKGVATTETWYYELPLPEGRRGYTKSKPLAFDEFEECQRWWGGVERVGRVETSQAWCVSVEDLKERGYNLDLTNPHGADDLANHDPVELVADLIKTEHQILGLLEELQAELVSDR
ncbi:SAM-dependent methyltransferase [Actinosynnema sp. ALI-1.44]|nr:SAM-dependent methyltransferase [Actinosynnema sp. ALI-1.44]